LSTTPEGYEAAITVRPDGHPEETWTVRHDSRLTRKAGDGSR
jgi:hypothetical protein